MIGVSANKLPDPHCKWWNLAFTSQARREPLHTFLVYFRECKLAPDLATITPEPRYTRPPHGTTTSAAGQHANETSSQVSNYDEMIVSNNYSRYLKVRLMKKQPNMKHL